MKVWNRQSEKDLTNPYPTEVREDDWEIYANYAEVVDMRTIK